MHAPIGILNRNSTMIIASAIVNSKKMFNVKTSSTKIFATIVTSTTFRVNSNAGVRDNVSPTRNGNSGRHG